MPTEEAQSAILSLESDDTPLGKEEDIALSPLHALARLIRDLKVSLHNVFHLVVSVTVDEWLAGLKAKEPCAYGGCGTD